MSPNANTSATGGVLAPVGPPPAAPLDGQSLDDFLEQLVAGITGLPNALVRPRWQREPPNPPALGVDWCAMGVARAEPDPGFIALLHDGTVEPPYSEQRLHETLDLLCTFYGDNADVYAGLLRDGFQVPQNLEVLQLNAMGLVEVGGAAIVPELIKTTWWRRVDRRVRLHREVRRVYPILNIASVKVTVQAQGPGDADLLPVYANATSGS